MIYSVTTDVPQIEPGPLRQCIGELTILAEHSKDCTPELQAMFAKCLNLASFPPHIINHDSNDGKPDA